MTAIRQVLVATDLSDFGIAAIRYGEAFHKHAGSSMTAVFVNEPPVPYDMFDAAAYASLERYDVREALERRLLGHVAAAIPDPESIDRRVVEGFPARAILDTAREVGADLIVTGTHGRTGWRRALLGSVAERVPHESRCPVLTVTPEAARHEPLIQTILCPVNFTEVSEDALRYASFLASTFHAGLMVVHVADDIQASLEPFVAETFSPWVDAALRQECRYVQMIVRRGHAAEEVLRLSDERKVSLIVLGAQHRRFWDDTVIGTTSERIVRFANLPVMTVVRREKEERARSAA